MDEDKEKRMPFLEHLRELRDRLAVSVAAIVVGMIICFFLSEKGLGGRLSSGPVDCSGSLLRSLFFC